MVQELPRRATAFGTGLALSIAGTGSVAGATAATGPTPTVGIQSTVASVLQFGEGNHVAAVLAVVVLAVLGTILIVRNRLDVRVETADEEPTDEVLTDRERVRRLVTQNGGRMKQSEIVESVDWSKAKVSRLLADLESDGEITKLRLGRENLICLPENEPTASKSSDRRRE